MRLNWHQYRYYPYERELAAREVAALLRFKQVQEIEGGLELGSELINLSALTIG